MYCDISFWRCTGLKKTVPVQKKSVPVQKKLELVQIQIVPMDKLNYNIYLL